MSAINVLQLNHIQKQTGCEMNVKGSIYIWITVKPLRAKTACYIYLQGIKKVFAVISRIICLFSDHPSFLRFLTIKGHCSSNDDRMRGVDSYSFWFCTCQSRLFKVKCLFTSSVRRPGVRLYGILSVCPFVCVIPINSPLQWWATGGWPLSVWVWSPPPVKSNVDRESRTPSEY